MARKLQVGQWYGDPNGQWNRRIELIRNNMVYWRDDGSASGICNQQKFLEDLGERIEPVREERRP